MIDLQRKEGYSELAMLTQKHYNNLGTASKIVLLEGMGFEKSSFVDVRDQESTYYNPWLIYSRPKGADLTDYLAISQKGNLLYASDWFNNVSDGHDHARSALENMVKQYDASFLSPASKFPSYSEFVGGRITNVQEKYGTGFMGTTLSVVEAILSPFTYMFGSMICEITKENNRQRYLTSNGLIEGSVGWKKMIDPGGYMMC
ncbi:hypothetical protein K9M79_01985 [Candidatus Woesearchaeota archaeon]|nr:hypothetical protein [Candidatus Woesearchaeota archaeon]